jgi:hypothetical protein
MKLIEIEKPSEDKKKSIDQAKEDFDEMMKSIKPFSKKKHIIKNSSKLEWVFNE